ncbi:MAG: amidohydrolase [Anaerotruncus sp.]|nr:amidohydrolase [Anaerotruncus sp.]
MLIDFHVHLFPERLAAHTLTHLSEIAHAPYYTDGTSAGTLQKMQEWGVDYAVVQHIATRAKQQEKINAFALQVQNSSPQLIGFGTVFPDAQDALETARAIRQMGLHGVKLHPEYQNFFLREERYFPLYEQLARLELPVTLHAGWDPVSEPGAPLHASAEDIAFIAKQFPDLKIIAAHMGSLGDPEASERWLAGLPNVYFDTAMSAPSLKPEQIARLVRLHGAQRILFGTDAPWSTVPKELELLRQAGLNDEELSCICWKNAAKLLGLSIGGNL